MKSPLEVMCPTCFARPGASCRSVSPLVVARRKVHQGLPCRAHPARRASASGFRLVAHTDTDLDQRVLAAAAQHNDPVSVERLSIDLKLPLTTVLKATHRLHDAGNLPCAKGCPKCDEASS